MERHLRGEAGLDDDQIARCFEYALEDPGPMDLDDIVPQGYGVRSFYMIEELVNDERPSRQPSDRCIVCLPRAFR